MSDRWKMNRIGFVNFWYYDEEEFLFEDGKLLLRGQNGSGKSITTQSFIPFILDGDRSPSRLDPFGSKDRRMEYYFLGEGDKDEATGYLFLEFKKEESGQYRTLGIGQRARKGKSMDFWGFVIMDGRRVGQDLFLYKEVGSSKIPLDKQEMRKVLGEENPFTEAPGEYKALVNRHLFGFRKPEQYEQFIQLLIKVRAPKLSKDLNPTKIYEILNESLQTLSDEDLRVMVDAMEKMDGIQENLEQLKRAVKDVETIRNEYKRYNQYILAKKGQFYLESKRDVDQLRTQMDAREQERRFLAEECAGKEERERQVQETLRIRSAERDNMMDPELENIDRKLERAKTQQKEAQDEEEGWKRKWNQFQERIRESDQKLRQYTGEKELQKKKLQEEGEELESLQEVLQWKGHSEAIRFIKETSCENTTEVTRQISEWKGKIEEGRHAVMRSQTAEKQYDEQAQKLEEITKKVSGQKLLAEIAERDLEDKKDEWISAVFHASGQAAEYKISKEHLNEAEQIMKGYQGPKSAGEIGRILREDYEKDRNGLLTQKSEDEAKRKLEAQERDKIFEKIRELKNQAEVEPERSKEVIASRERLKAAGISFIPFYRAVEFHSKLTEIESSMLEAQLTAMGLLDALVVAEKDQKRIRQEFPEVLDTVITVNGEGDSDFDRLIVNEEIEPELRAEVQRILRSIYEEERAGQICLKGDGSFRQGVLSGRMSKEESASYVGTLARKQKKERMIGELQKQMEQRNRSIEEIDARLKKVGERLLTLEQEYGDLPGFEALDEALQIFAGCRERLKRLEEELKEQEQVTAKYEDEKKKSYQQMLQSCRELPYGRTEREYEEALQAAEDYKNTWIEICGILQKLQRIIAQILNEREMIDREEENAETAEDNRRKSRSKKTETEALIRQYEEYLHSPEIQEKARKLKDVKEEIDRLEEEGRTLHDRLLLVRKELADIRIKEEEDKSLLQDRIGRETYLRSYFEEELSLKLILDRKERTPVECAREAVKLPREGDLEREYGALFQSLFTVFQQHNGNLVSYGTAMEDCFEDAEEPGAVRKRVQIVSVWNGKKLYLEEFYHILKSAVEDTELLIQKKDREIFEDILSQTISGQLTDRIAESRSWVKSMSELMKNMDTSMGLSFALDWKPQSAENDQELDTAELEHILLRDRNLLTQEDIEKVAAHFRSKIRTEKLQAEESGSTVNYMDLVRDALDYRKWFMFQMSYYRNHGEKKPLTNAAFNRFSGGEKAMAMYVPLFAAVNAQYKKAEEKSHPRIIALDEAFAGVDDKNISSMFELVERLDFDYVMNSQVLWGCFETVRGLKIAELLRPLDSNVVTVIRYTWNGRERVLDEQ